jgi:RNA polymerase sigma-70 factor (ECF subfamily)
VESAERLVPGLRFRAQHAASDDRLGDDAHRAFADALVAQLPALRRFAAALSGSLPMADDLVQDCIERALRKSDQLREPHRLGAWLRTIMHNVFVNELRRRRHMPTQDIEELVEELSSSGPDPTVTRDFVRALNGLSAEHREILLLAGLEGLSYREIAATLDLPIGTVMSRLARARGRMREALDGPGDAARANAEPDGYS